MTGERPDKACKERHEELFEFDVAFARSLRAQSSPRTLRSEPHPSALSLMAKSAWRSLTTAARRPPATAKRAWQSEASLCDGPLSARVQQRGG